MKFFVIPRNYLPQSLPSETQSYIRATFGLLAAVTTTINPIVGALVLLSHGTLELAGFFTKSGQQEHDINPPIMSKQERREQKYNEAFDKLLLKAQELGTQCSPQEIENAKRIFFVHNLIEEVCYKAFAKIVKQLGITGDEITEQQSGQILAYIKSMAHVELRKPGGYTLTGRAMITADQFAQVISNVSTIIHDRDARLTDARYYSLTDLCVGLDDHNSYVKNILFRSWFKCGQMSCDSHLNMIKDMVGFNKRISDQLGFNFEHALTNKKEYYNTYHAGIRTVENPVTGERSALKFTNLTEVRSKFKPIINKLLDTAPDSRLIAELRNKKLLEPEEINALIGKRSYLSAPRFHQPITQNALLEPTITVGEFLNYYFPELQVQNTLTPIIKK
ncbi:hypothetical protein [Legionella bononiensis]|uniref:Substrate of the Dot/Icm secretion system n=1 Tax=Legionella bononiensis TaxID=2793102 RepID=A0ABS1WEA1_9GAMM|nr:hypothetical protein [Legionella bononiensis]MBL7479437.1 hypothetical protein [Legionella bononiensis]MBL7527690.1 hypothetical protein [Legionella bononiensis]